MSPSQNNSNVKQLREPSFIRRSTDSENWEQRVERLARDLCSDDEVKQYKRLRATIQKDTTGRLATFPVWRKYKSKAERIASMHKMIPLLRRLPHNVNDVLGKILLK